MTERIPKPLPLPIGRTIQSYPLLPVDGFVLSRIDGSVREEELATFTGLDAGTIDESLVRLANLGLVERTGLPEPEPEAQQDLTLDIPEQTAVDDAPELNEEVDIDIDHRKRILLVFRKLAELDHYALLEIGRDADKKAVKKKYYELATVFHPDRYFRKRLGSFKQKMEIVFSRITEAHDTLANAERRADYDGYLTDQVQATQIERQIAMPAPDVMPPAIPQPISAGVAVSERARRDALARRLLGGRARISSIPPPNDPDALKRHYEQRVTFAKEKVLRDHLESARTAMSKNDPVNAVNFFRLALEIAPEDAAVREEFEAAQVDASEILADTYRRQAKYEEKNQQWAAAARNWSKVAKTRPNDASAQHRAAAAILKGEGNLHEAAAFGALATKLDPEKALYRVTLAQVYAAAGLGLNARREIEAAARMAPDDATIQTLLKTLSKK